MGYRIIACGHGMFALHIMLKPHSIFSHLVYTGTVLECATIASALDAY